MTQEQTIKVLELLNAFYAGGKNDPKQQVIAWHLILQDYDFEDAMNAVLAYAREDRREYAQFPTVGRIIEQIEKAFTAKSRTICNVIHSIAYGKPYSELGTDEKLLINKSRYDDWLNMDAEEFANKNHELADELKQIYKFNKEHPQIEANIINEIVEGRR